MSYDNFYSQNIFASNELSVELLDTLLTNAVNEIHNLLVISILIEEVLVGCENVGEDENSLQCIESDLLFGQNQVGGIF